MKKALAFFTCMCGLATIALIAASLGTETWAIVKINRQNDSNNCIITRTIGLFGTLDTFQSCIVSEPNEYSTLFSELLQIEAGLFYATLVCSALAILLAICASSVAAYNLCSRPYETWAGPVGLLCYFTIGFTLNLIAVIIFVVAGYVDLNDTVPQTCTNSELVICKVEDYRQSGWEFGFSFYILISGLAPFILGFVLVLISGKSLQKKIKIFCCPGILEEPEEKHGRNNNDFIMY